MAKTKSQWAHKKLKLSHHKHTGKRLPSHHTSWGALMVIALAAGIMLLIVTRAFSAQAQAITITGDGVLNFRGFLPPPKPNQPATIETPVNKQIFNSYPIDIHGSCATFPDQVMVVVIDNGLNMGQMLCNNGRYDLKIDLLISNKYGINYLRVRQFEQVDNFLAAGAESTVIKVFYYPRGPAAAVSAGNQLKISASGPASGVMAGQPFKIKANISGGTAPYAVDVKWGDSTEDVVSRPVAGEFELSHVYKIGSVGYSIILNASDAQNQRAYFQTSTVIGGQKKTGAAGALPSIPYVGPSLAVIWPVYLVCIGAIAIFWLGEKFGYRQGAKDLWKSRRTK